MRSSAGRASGPCTVTSKEAVPSASPGATGSAAGRRSAVVCRAAAMSLRAAISRSTVRSSPGPLSCPCPLTSRPPIRAATCRTSIDAALTRCRPADGHRRRSAVFAAAVGERSRQGHPHALRGEGGVGGQPFAGERDAQPARPHAGREHGVGSPAHAGAGGVETRQQQRRLTPRRGRARVDGDLAAGRLSEMDSAPRPPRPLQETTSSSAAGQSTTSGPRAKWTPSSER